MISDAMLTSDVLSIKFEHRTPKLTELSDNCVAATAGDALAHTPLFELAKTELNNLKSPLVSDIVDCLKICYKELRQKEILERIIAPRGFPDFETFYKIQRELHPDVSLSVQRQIDTYSIGGEEGVTILVGGVDTKGAHIHVVGNPGISVSFDAIGYNAIGSGTPHALATFISREYHHLLPLNEALLIAYEAKKISEKAPGVGDKITNICVIDEGILQFDEDDVKELDRVYYEKKKSETEFTKTKDWANELKNLFKGLREKRRKK